MNSIVQISLWGYAALMAMGIVSATLVQLFTRSHGWKLVWAQLRMTFQLVAMGFVLVGIFNHPHPLISVGAVSVMEVFAVYTVVWEHRRRVPRRVLSVNAVGLVVGSLLTCAVFIATVVGINPLVNPRYLLPLLGMIIGNSMTAINLTIGSMRTQVEAQTSMVTTALLLGSTKADAVAPLAREAFVSGLTPTITAMLSLGVVMIPGMMTGQILSGSLPLVAVAYQLAIMVAILFAIVISTLFALKYSGPHYLAHIPD